MRRLYILFMSLFAMMTAGLSAKAQEITISLHPGWNWISYPNAEVMDISSALSGFAPMEGDQIKSRNATSRYSRGHWSSGVTQFTPGCGYMYYSNRTQDTSFVFGSSIHLTVTTDTLTDITGYSASCSGSVTLEGNSFVLMKGVCWAAHPNPNANDDFHSENGTGTGSFTAYLTNLNMNTVYYIRAYAVLASGVTYGEELSFITPGDQVWENGILPGAFSVSGGHQVYFSQGNLQYIGSAETPYWRFATHQWNCLGSTTGQDSNSENVDRDLFGWGTSGYHDENDPYNVNYQPWSTSSQTVNSTYNKYGYGPSTNMPSPNLTEGSANYDWGVYNAVSNGGNQPNQWRTLTPNEWNYLFTGRATESGIRFARGCVNGMNGVILLPDNWNLSVYSLNDTDDVEAGYGSNVISADDWTNILELNGAVFLPAAGLRIGTTVGNMGDDALYWSSSNKSSSNAYNVFSSSTMLNLNNSFLRCNGISVRLVHDIE